MNVITCNQNWLFKVWCNVNCLMFGISEIVIALCELRLNWKMNTWIMTLIGIISHCLKTILKTRQHCHGCANLVMKSSETSPNENQNLCFSLVWGWAPEFKAEPWKMREDQHWVRAQWCLALKNARRMGLSASRAVPQCWDPYRSGTQF